MTSHVPASSVVVPGVSSLLARTRLDASGVGVGQIILLGSMQISIRPDVEAITFLTLIWGSPTSLIGHCHDFRSGLCRPISFMRSAA